MEYENLYSDLVNDCANQGKALMQKLANEGICESLYLYVRPSTETENGKLFLVRDSAPVPEGYQLVTGEGLRVNVPYSFYYQWVYDRSRRAPLYAFGKNAA